MFLFNLEWKVYHKKDKQVISGIYMAVLKYRKNSEIIYIGMSKNINKRIASHEMWRHDFKGNLFFIYYSNSSFDKNNKERFLIKKVKPLFNSKTKRDYMDGLSIDSEEGFSKIINTSLGTDFK